MAASTKKKELTGLQRQFLAARDKSVPLVAVRTADPASTIKSLNEVCATNDDRPAPVAQWDAVSGIVGVTGNTGGAAWATAIKGSKISSPVEACMVAGDKLPDNGTLIMMNGNDYYNDPAFRQAMWNLRDPFKRNFRTLVVTQASGGVPMALEHDFLLIDEPLPGPEELSAIVREQHESAGLAVPSDDVLLRAVDATSGLSAFAAEQAVALSLRRTGIDLLALRERHRQMIENTKGLTVYRGGEKFDSVGGLQSFITFAKRFIGGRYRPGAVLFIDEIEKALAGIRGDLTGISQDYLASLLGYMQDNGVPGILLMGHPGTGKSLLAKSFGNEAGIPTIKCDLGAMHGSLVGESQHALRHALKITTAVSQGRPVVIATCNSVAVLPPELVNRFKWRFFVDLPDEAEKKVVWNVHMKRRNVDPKMVKPNDMGWNGREIDQCVETAYQLDCSLLEASESVVPISQSSSEAMATRRNEAHGRYLSASHKGVFLQDKKTDVVEVGGRKIELKDRDTWTAPTTSGKAN